MSTAAKEKKNVAKGFQPLGDRVFAGERSGRRRPLLLGEHRAAVTGVHRIGSEGVLVAAEGAPGTACR